MSENSHTATKDFLRYAFPTWDASKPESIVGTCIHYMGMFFFIPLSIYHNIQAIVSLEGLPYIWMFGILLVIDIVIVVLIGIVSEIILSWRIILKDTEIIKAFKNSQEAKNYLLGSYKKNVIIIGSLLTVLVASTIFFSLKGGNKQAVSKTEATHKPIPLLQQKAALKATHEADLDKWTAYYDGQIDDSETQMETHKEQVKYKGRINIHNPATQTVVSTHTANMDRQQIDKSQKLAALESAYNKMVLDLEKEHQEATQRYLAELDENQLFTFTYVWAFSVANVVFVIIGLLLNKEAIEKGLHKTMGNRLHDYLASRKMIYQATKELRKETHALRKEALTAESDELKEQLTTREELEEGMQFVDMLKELNQHADSHPIQISHGLKEEIVKLAKMHANGNDGNGISPEALRKEIGEQMSEQKEELATSEQKSIAQPIDLPEQKVSNRKPLTSSYPNKPEHKEATTSPEQVLAEQKTVAVLEEKDFFGDSVLEVDIETTLQQLQELPATTEESPIIDEKELYTGVELTLALDEEPRDTLDTAEESEQITVPLSSPIVNETVVSEDERTEKELLNRNQEGNTRQDLIVEVERSKEAEATNSEQTEEDEQNLFASEQENPEQNRGGANEGEQAVIYPKKTLEQYEQSHPLMVKYCRIEAERNFDKGYTGRIQSSMIADEQYKGESVSKATMSNIGLVYTNG